MIDMEYEWAHTISNEVWMKPVTPIPTTQVVEGNTPSDFKTEALKIIDDFFTTLVRLFRSAHEYTKIKQI
jgi:hypothetical protein